jgi:cytidylate kinase
MAKDLSRSIGYKYIDTGAMYRAVTLFALKKGFFKDGALDEAALDEALAGVKISFAVDPETGRTETFLGGENVEKEIRGMEVANHVSSVSALPFVRSVLVERQRLLGAEKGLVMDGRDIGTVVFPDAELKIFVTASAEIRALRRLEELTAKGENVSFEEILANVKSRDRQDTSRAISPLRKAADAVEIDNSCMSIAEQNAWLLDNFNRVAGNDKY